MLEKRQCLHNDYLYCSEESVDLIWNVGSIWNKLVYPASVQYIIYISLDSPITCEPCIKEFCNHVLFISLVGSRGRNLSRSHNSIHFVGITYIGM